MSNPIGEFDEIQLQGGELVMRFAGPPSRSEYDSIAEEYAIVRTPLATSGGVIVWAKYDDKWEPNPYSVRPVIAVLLDLLAAKDDLLRQQGDRIAGLVEIVAKRAEKVL